MGLTFSKFWDRMFGKQEMRILVRLLSLVPLLLSASALRMWVFFYCGDADVAFSLLSSDPPVVLCASNSLYDHRFHRGSIFVLESIRHDFLLR